MADETVDSPETKYKLKDPRYPLTCKDCGKEKCEGKNTRCQKCKLANRARIHREYGERNPESAREWEVRRATKRLKPKTCKECGAFADNNARLCQECVIISAVVAYARREAALREAAFERRLKRKTDGEKIKRYDINDSKYPKECKVCGVNQRRDGSLWCGSCKKADQDRRYDEWLAENHEALIEKKRQQYWEDPEKARTKANLQTERDKAFPDRVARKRKSAKESYERNREKRLASAAEARERKKAEDPEGFARYGRETRKISRANRSQEARLRDGLRGRISRRLRRSLERHHLSKTDACDKILGYTMKEAFDRLDSTMPADYGWNDFLDGDLQIDHIRPIAAFKFTSIDDPEFKECWALTNLQLLPTLENQRKNARLDWKPDTKSESSPD